MEQQFIELLKEVNIAQIFIIFAGGWVFYNRLDNKICKSEDRLSAQIKAVQANVETVQSESKGDIKTLQAGMTNDIKTLQAEMKNDSKTLQAEMKNDIKTLQAEIKSDIEKITNNIKTLSDKVEDIDRRLCRIEGGLELARFAYYQAKKNYQAKKKKKLESGLVHFPRKDFGQDLGF